MSLEEIGELNFKQINAILEIHCRRKQMVNERRQRTLKRVSKYTPVIDLLRLDDNG